MSLERSLRGSGCPSENAYSELEQLYSVIRWAQKLERELPPNAMLIVGDQRGGRLIQNLEKQQ